MFQPFAFRSKKNSTHTWIEFAELWLHPFQCVKNGVTWRQFQKESILIDFLKEYMRSLTESVKKIFSYFRWKNLPLIFTNYPVAAHTMRLIFVNIFIFVADWLKLGLFGCSPMGEDDSLNVTEYCGFKMEVLQLFVKLWVNISGLICGN